MQRHDALQILCTRAYAVHHRMVLGMDIERSSGGRGMPAYLLAIFSNSSRVRNVCGRSGRLCLFMGLQLCTSQASVMPCVSLMLDIPKPPHASQGQSACPHTVLQRHLQDHTKA